MIDVINYNDEIVALTAAVGAILGVINLVRSIRDNRLKIEVTHEADYGDIFIITVVNKSKFDVTIADVGMLNDMGSLDSISIMSPEPFNTDLPQRIQSQGYHPFVAPVRLEYCYRVGGFRSYARTATGKVIYGPDPRTWGTRWVTKLKVRYGYLLPGNPFRDI